jgi:hypothetical protein
MDPSTCVICSNVSCVCEAVDRILSEPLGESAFLERRDARRTPCFRPVLIGLPGEGPPRFSAFTRDLSPQSIGMLHVMPLAQGDVVVRFPSAGKAPTDLLVELQWCEDCGEGWYMSGGRLLSLA